MKLCKDCQHFYQGTYDYYCLRKGFKIEPIFGKKVPILELHAGEEREYACGPEAKYFLQNAQSI